MRVSALAVCLASASFLSAAPITSLFNTGVDAGGSLLVGGNGIADTHWNVISGPGIGSPAPAVTFFNAAYLADGPDSRWIAPNLGSPGAGDYVFRTSFDLTGFNPSATTLTFNCGVDNRVTNVQINGTSVFGLGNSCDSYVNLGSDRTINTNFLGGLNTLDFTVQNDDGPVAFRAEFSSDTAALPNGQVPEPGTFLLSGAGLALFLYSRRRRAAKL